MYFTNVYDELLYITCLSHANKVYVSLLKSNDSDMLHPFL